LRARADRKHDVIRAAMLDHAQRLAGVALGNADLLDPQGLVGAQHLVQEGDHGRPDHRRGDAHSAGEVGRHDRVRADLLHLVDPRDVVAAGDDAHLGVEALRGEGDHQVAAVVPHHCEHPGGALDAGILEHRVLGCVAVQEDRVGVALAKCVDVRLVRVDDHERAVGAEELARHVRAHAPDAAHDVMARHSCDPLQHASSPQCDVDFALDDERRELGKDEPGGGDAGKAEHHREHAADRGLAHVHGLGVADRGDGDERHVQAVEQRVLVAADEAVGDRADQVQQEEERERPGEAPLDALQEERAHHLRPRPAAAGGDATAR
jgi:hypothetical protein